MVALSHPTSHLVEARLGRYQDRMDAMSASAFRAGESRTRFRPEISTRAKSSQDAQVGTQWALQNMWATVNNLITDHPLIRQALDAYVALGNVAEIHPQPKTNDAELNVLLYKAWDDYADNPERCDAAKKHTFSELTAIAVWLQAAHGDVCAPIAENSAISIQEAWRMRSPNFYNNMSVSTTGGTYGFQGIVKNATGEATSYWLTKSSGLPLDRVQIDDVVEYPARDENGHCIFLHPCGIGRPSTRPLSKLAPISDLAYMQNDLMFVKLVQEQISACVTSCDEMPIEGFENLKKLATDFPELVKNYYSACTSSYAQRADENNPGVMKPGRHDILFPSVKRSFNNPNLSPANYQALNEFMTMAASVNLDCPAIAVTLNARDANYSSFKNVIWNTELRMQVTRKSWVAQWYVPTYQHVMRRLASLALSEAGQRDTSELMVAIRKYLGPGTGNTVESFLACDWSCPEYPYIDPLKEIGAYTLERAEGHITDSQWCNKHHAMSWPAYVQQMVHGRGLALEAAFREKRRLLDLPEFSDADTQAEIRKIPITVFMPIPLPKAYAPGTMEPPPPEPVAASEPVSAPAGTGKAVVL